jgi:hypothetical protein
MKKCLVAICISFVLAASAAVADGILSGYVRTSSGQPVPYDQVTWGEFCGPEQSHTFTDINGYWRTPDNWSVPILRATAYDRVSGVMG